MTERTLLVRDPSEEVVRVATALVRLTWLHSMDYAYRISDGADYLVLRTGDDWHNAPSEAKAWLEDQRAHQRGS